MIKYSYDDFTIDLETIYSRVIDFNADAIVCIARGGMSLAHQLSIMLDIRDVLCINSIYYDDKQKQNDINIFNIPNLDKYSRVLLVDDIVDSGKTMRDVLEILNKKYKIEYKSLSIFYKKNSIFTPDIWIRTADSWVEFFWESIQKKYCIVLTTTKNKNDAKNIAKVLLDNSLASCVQISKINSYYNYKNKIQKSKERKVEIKTRNSLYEKLEKKLLEIHSYEVPQIIKIDINNGDQKYLNWINSTTKV
jgi:xanthine phosphoribosyltransferase